MVQSARAVASDGTATAVQLIGVGAVCAIVPALVHNGARGQWGLVTALAIEAAVVLSCLVLNRKGAPRLASRILPLSSVALAAALTFTCPLGVLGVPTLIYPAAIVVSGALLDTIWFVAVVVLCMAVVALQYVLEWSGARTSVLSQYVELRFLVDTESILAVTALATGVLVRTLRKSVLQAQSGAQLLREGEARYRTLVENSPDVIARFDRDVRYQFVNSAIRRVSPLKPDDFKGKTMAEVGFTREQADKRESMIRGVIATGVPAEAELEADARGELRVYEWRACPEFDSSGVVQSVLTFNRDITDRKRADEEHQLLQKQLHRAQRMESIGRLAGGVSHDFNNMLGVILGETELTLDDLSKTDPRRAPLERIQQAAQRSAALTRQLLAFARRQPIAPEVLDLNKTLEGMLHMFRRLIGEDIALTWNPGCDLWPVRIESIPDRSVASKPLCQCARRDHGGRPSHHRDLER